MTEGLPLSALLSLTLVAFTIEFDNESERQVAASASRRTFLVSLPMWANFMRFIPEDGLSAGQLQALAGVSESSLRARLNALKRWRYVDVEPARDEERSRPPFRDWIVRPTRSGLIAQAIWRPLEADIEARWAARFGASALDELRHSLQSIVTRLDVALPQYLPVIGYGMFAKVEPLPGLPGAVAGLGLSALLATVLLALTLDFERESAVSLAISANALRVLREDGIPVRDLPELTGVAKETLAVALGFLEKHGDVVLEAAPAGERGKVARLTARGVRAQNAARQLMAGLERRWGARFGEPEVARLRASLRAILDARDGETPRLAQGLSPSPSGWRARRPYAAQTEAMLRDPIAALPQYPMVSHRGGFPDGS